MHYLLTLCLNCQVDVSNNAGLLRDKADHKVSEANGGQPATLVLGGESSIGVGAGGQGIGPPLLGLGDYPPTFSDTLKVLMLKYRNEVPKLTQNCIILSAKLFFFFWRQAPRAPTGRVQPLPRPNPFTLHNIYPPLLACLRRH